MNYLRFIYSKRKTIFTTITLCFVLTLLFNSFSDREYIVRTSFFLTPDLPKSGINSTLASYSSLLGGSMGSQNLEKQIIAIVDSNRIQNSVAQKFLPDLGDDLKQVKAKLQLKNILFSQDSNGVFILRFFHTDPQIAYRVVNAYIESIYELNLTLEISPQSNLITILDHPEVPENPFRPKKLLNLILSIILGTMLGTVSIFFKHFYTRLTQ